MGVPDSTKTAIETEMGFGSGSRRNPLVYRLIKAIAAIVFHVFYRLQVHGVENIPHHGPAIILPKHQYWTDIPIVSLALRPQLSYIAKAELFTIPLIRTLLSLLGGIPVNRERTTKTMESFRYMLQLLRKKEYVVIFPEGTYYRGKVGKGKSRLIKMILRWQDNRRMNDTDPIPFVPMGIHYGGKGLRKMVTVEIGRPISAEGEDRALRFTDQIIESIARLSGLSRG